MLSLQAAHWFVASTFGLEKNANGIANGPSTRPIKSQNRVSAERDRAIK